jgi:hypothetical protein
MAMKVWEVQKVCYCEHIGQDVALEAHVLYPADFIPEMNARILAHRCSQGMSCNLDNRASCIWAGTNPVIDPFIETI